MADKELHELTSWTPALTDITVFWWPAGWAEVKKSTFSSIKDLLKTSYDALYQAILVSGTNIKTINSNSLLWSGDLSIPALTDWDKGDIVVSGSGATWTVDNDAISFAKMQNITWDRILWRVSWVSWDIWELTGTQVNTLLPDATTSLWGRMSSADKTKLDGLSNEWTALTNSTYTAGGTYNSGTLTAYDLYKIVISGTSTAWSTQIRMQVNSDWTASSYETKYSTSTSTSISTLTDNYFRILNHNVWSWSPFYTELIMTSSSCKITNVSWQLADWELINWGYKSATVSSIQLSTIIAISGKIQIFGKNF